MVQSTPIPIDGGTDESGAGAAGLDVSAVALARPLLIGDHLDRPLARLEQGEDGWVVGWANDAFCRWTGRSLAEVLTEPLQALVGAGAGFLEELARGALQTGTPATAMDVPFRLTDSVTVAPVQTADGSPPAVLVHFTAAAEVVRRRATGWRTVAAEVGEDDSDLAVMAGRFSPQALIALEADDLTIAWANHRARQMLASDAVGESIEEYFHLGAGRIQPEIVGLLHGAASTAHLIEGFVVVGREHQAVPVSLGAARVAWRDGEMRMVLALTDRTPSQDREQRLIHAATHDPLTGLPNRGLLLDRLERAITRTRRVERTVAVLFLDLDRFKSINDTVGHAAGDELLAAVAVRLRACLRPSDTAARLGGDEFVLLCEDIASPRDGGHIAERVASVLDEPFRLRGETISISASIGIALDDGSQSAVDLISQADTAMYRAKDLGRARFEIFDERLSREAIERLELERELAKAIEQGTISVVFQPICSLATGEVRAVEALARWHHPTLGEVPPSRFVAVAEDTGAIHPLGDLVVDRACASVAAWDRELGASSLRVSVNVSALQLRDQGLPSRILQSVEAHGLTGDRLQVELTESALLDDREGAARILGELRDAGVRIAIDDFGQGYTSLAYLRDLPIDVLKIDRAFMEGLGTDPRDSSVVSALIGLAHSFQLEAIAEGVETKAQLRALRFLDCDLAQGYYLAHPHPADEIGALLR